LAGSKNPLTAIALGPLTPQTLISTRVPVTTIDTVANFRFQVLRQTPNAVLDAL